MRVLFLCLSVIVIYSCGVKKKYEKAEAASSIAAYEKYIKEYPDGKYTPQAKEHLSALYEERDWRYAEYYKSIKRYEQFVQKHPSSKYIPQAEQALKKLYEDRDWSSTLKLNTISAYKNFIAKYANSQYTQTAQLKLTELELEQAWDKARDANSIYAYQAFIESYPTSSYVYQAKLNIKNLEDDIAWENAEQAGSISAYKAYLENFPAGKKRTTANDRIREMEIIKPEWSQALRKNTPEAYRKFIRQYGQSSYAAEAEKKLEELEREYWRKANNRGSKTAYKKYISSFPYGRYTEEAEKAIIDIEVDNIFKGDYGELPPMRKAYSNDYKNTNKIELFNNTQYTLTVWYSGQEDSRKIVLSPNQRESFSLDNGTYRVAASVNASNVTNYAGKEQLTGGSYTSQFYIQMRNY